jgi:excisionase family DNA binding protein
MSTHSVLHNDFVIPDKKESSLAVTSSRKLAPCLHANQSVTIQLTGKNNIKATAILPGSAFRLLLDILTQMAAGNAVSVVPMEKELTTQTAADLLGVSRPYFVQLIENGAIPFRKVGKHRRVLATDVLEYKTKINKAREKSLLKLTEQAQKLNMGYDDE